MIPYHLLSNSDKFFVFFHNHNEPHQRKNVSSSSFVLPPLVLNEFLSINPLLQPHTIRTMVCCTSYLSVSVNCVAFHHRLSLLSNVSISCNWRQTPVSHVFCPRVDILPITLSSIWEVVGSHHLLLVPKHLGNIRFNTASLCITYTC